MNIYGNKSGYMATPLDIYLYLDPQRSTIFTKKSVVLSHNQGGTNEATMGHGERMVGVQITVFTGVEKEQGGVGGGHTYFLIACQLQHLVNLKERF